MVKIRLKRNKNIIFLYETVTPETIIDLITNIIGIFNGRLKLEYICRELEELSQYGVMLPQDGHGLSAKISDLSLDDESAMKYVPTGGHIEITDPSQRRNGKRPSEDMRNLIHKAIAEIRTTISEEQVKADVSLTRDTIHQLREMIQSTILAVYPMGLPSYDIIQQELDNFEDFSTIKEHMGTIDQSSAELWWANKRMSLDKKLMDYVGRNEKTKVIVKLQRRGEGAPSRESAFSEEEQKQMMLQQFRRQKELQELEENADDTYLNSEWADGASLKLSFQGLQNISWKPK